jgi:hypothetical protein
LFREEAVLDSGPSLLEILAQLATSQATFTLKELFQRARLSGLDLDKIRTIDALCKLYNLELIPGLNHGDRESPRRLRFRPRAVFGIESALKEIERGESQDLEFKSSLWFDHQRAEREPATPVSELKSEVVLHSSLKSVAALMNTNGGVLYIGVRDNGHPIGIEADYAFLKPEKRSPDGFELALRDLIKDRFYRGNSVNDSVHATFVLLDDRICTIVRVEVVPRPQLAFLRGSREQSYHLYRRQGNRTTEVRIEEFEDFLANRQQQGDA